MKDLLWNCFKGFMKESVFADMWQSICNLLKHCLTGIYGISFYVLLILCIYNIILATLGSKEGKIKAVSCAMIWAMVTMVASMLGVN